MREGQGDIDGRLSSIGPRARMLVLGANYLSSFTIGIAVGGIVPFLSLVLERRGVGEAVIGLNAAIGSLGIIALAPFVPALVRRFGLMSSVTVGILLSVASILAMWVFDSVAAWFVLRFLFAAGLAIHWIVSETWMNAVATRANRGRVMSIYVTAIAAGFASGPAVLTVVGSEGFAPFVLFAVGTAAGAVPLALVARWAPVIAGAARGTPWMLARVAPTVFAAVVAVGLYGGASFALLPIYGLRAGLDEADAVFLLTVFLAGNVIFQIPIGWLADRINHRVLLLACTCVALAVPPVLFAVLDTGLVLIAVAALWGGAVFAFYTVGITMLGERFESGELVAANAAYVMTFEIANAIGPPVAGAAMALWNPHGMMALLFAVAAVFALVTLLRGVRRD